MSIATTTNRVRTQANGSAVDFAFTFKTFSQSDLKVYTVVRATGVSTLKTITTDYTVALNTVTPGGTVTFLSAPASTLDVLIVRELEITQSTDVPNRGSLREEQIENVYDRLTMIDQQLQEQIDRCIIQDVAGSVDLQLPAAVANKYLGWDADGEALENKDGTGEAGPAGADGVDGGAVEVTLTDGATPALDASLGNAFILTAAGNRTIAVPSNPTNGKRILIRHKASGGARTLALNTGAGGFRFGSTITALTETASGKTDYIGCIWNSVDSYWDVVAYVKGF
jgi:hypothetical protein